MTNNLEFELIPISCVYITKIRFRVNRDHIVWFKGDAISSPKKKLIMETIPHLYNSDYVMPARKESLLTRFISWAKNQERHRLGWLAVIITGHGCVLTPITLFAIILSGNSMVFWSMAIAAMGMSLITNLAALPTKITIPVFFFSVLIDLVIIINCIVIGFNIAATSI